MVVMQKFKDFITKLTGFFQYYYACIRNHYPCKLVGEKRSNETNNAIIVFRKLGKARSIEIPIKELLADTNLVASFHPAEALKIGAVALEEFIFELAKNDK